MEQHGGFADPPLAMEDHGILVGGGEEFINGTKYIFATKEDIMGITEGSTSNIGVPRTQSVRHQYTSTYSEGGTLCWGETPLMYGSLHTKSVHTSLAHSA
jgi:hypothetical protein